MSTDGAPLSSAAYRTARDRLVADRRVDGGAFRRALCAVTDEWLAALFDDAARALGGPSDGIALVALGGYGRGELWPGSDLDLAVVHRRQGDVAAEIAEAVWYPVWDTGVHLGHSVRSLDDAVGLVGVDVESSTALLDARLLAGDAGVADELRTQVRDAWVATLGASTDWLRADAETRRAKAGDVAFSVEPNLKIAGGGLRDGQIPDWLGVADDLIGADDATALATARRWLGDVRLALHRCGPSSGDVLRLEDQDAVAEALGVADADVLMTQVAGAARSISWVLDEVWVQSAARSARARGHGRRAGTTRRDETGDDGDTWDVADPAAVLVGAARAARARQRLGRPLLSRLAAAMPPPSVPWSPPTREAFVALLSAGPGAIRVIESLDQVGVWERFVPEWPAVRTRAQRTTHHRYTVDRHLLETVALAATFGDRVVRGDLLVVAALLHDLGKGRGPDHTEAGVALTAQIAPRMGFDPADTAVLTALVRHHLLLPEVATRRDIADAATIRSVASAVSSVELLGLLLALTEADARATGPTAWTDWKAGLVRTLVERVGATLTGTEADHFSGAFPTPEQTRLLAAGETVVRGEGHSLTVVAPDRQRLFCRVAGALVLAGLNVVSAAVTSSQDMALEEFTVVPAFASPELADAIAVDWPSVTAEVERAMAGRVAIAARVAARAVTYRRRPTSADAEVRIRFDDLGDADTGLESVIEVDAPDRMGVLFAITHALAELDIDVRYARVETQTDRVIDAFSIVDADGAPVTDPAYRSEIERAILHAVAG